MKHTNKEVRSNVIMVPPWHKITKYRLNLLLHLRAKIRAPRCQSHKVRLVVAPPSWRPLWVAVRDIIHLSLNQSPPHRLSGSTWNEIEQIKYESGTCLYCSLAHWNINMNSKYLWDVQTLYIMGLFVLLQMAASRKS